MLKLNKPDYIFIAAARVGGILENSSYPANFIYDNLSIALNLIHLSYKNNINEEEYNILRKSYKERIKGKF